MKRTMWFFYLFLISLRGFSQYHPVDKGSSVHFTIKNFGFNVSGSFSGLQGEVQFNPENLSEARFQVSVDAATINTDNNIRDGHLKEEDYLDVKNHSRIRFVSENIRAKGKKGYIMRGKLTIKEKTKEIEFPFIAEASGKGFLFSGSFKINRNDFEVGGSSTLSDNLTVNLKVLAQ